MFFGFLFCFFFDVLIFEYLLILVSYEVDTLNSLVPYNTRDQLCRVARPEKVALVVS